MVTIIQFEIFMNLWIVNLILACFWKRLPILGLGPILPNASVLGATEPDFVKMEFDVQIVMLDSCFLWIITSFFFFESWFP